MFTTNEFACDSNYFFFLSLRFLVSNYPEVINVQLHEILLQIALYGFYIQAMQIKLARIYVQEIISHYFLFYVTSERRSCSFILTIFCFMVIDDSLLLNLF